MAKPPFLLWVKKKDPSKKKTVSFNTADNEVQEIPSDQATRYSAGSNKHYKQQVERAKIEVAAEKTVEPAAERSAEKAAEAEYNRYSQRR
jgi:protein-tyrosine-phosphatase